MKKILYLVPFLLAILFLSCKKPSHTKSNSVLLLKIDYLTHNFEGGKQLNFIHNNKFSLEVDYQSPADFGHLNIYYKELNEPIFKGTLAWMATGSRSFPEHLLDSSSFVFSDYEIARPALSRFEDIIYPFSEENKEPMINIVWNAIDNVQMVQSYLILNKKAKIHYFLYARSQGIGDPAEWDYYVILKN